jgi:hypothetical protein
MTHTHTHTHTHTYTYTEGKRERGEGERERERERERVGAAVYRLSVVTHAVHVFMDMTGTCVIMSQWMPP